jgi:hypothetical protein
MFVVESQALRVLFRAYFPSIRIGNNGVVLSVIFVSMALVSLDVKNVRKIRLSL